MGNLIEMKISIFLPIFCLVLLGYLADARPGKHRKGSGSGSKSTGSGESGSKSGSCSCADSSETVPAAPALPIRLSEFDRSQVADRKKKKGKKEKKQKKGKKGKKGSGSCSCEDDNESPATVIGVITAAPTPIRLWG